MKYLRNLLLLIAFCIPFWAYSQHTLIKDSLMSPSLDAMKYFYVLKPENKGQDKVPVIYMLHGAWGNYKNWIEKTSIQEYVKEMDMILIFPDADNSFYMNAKNGSGQYADYILNDLRSYVESKYPIDTRKRGVAGLSMGGYGAFYLGTLRPDLFIFSGSLSGALSIPGDGTKAIPEEQRSSALVKTMIGIFGEPDPDSYSKVNPVQIASRIDRQTAPYIYLVHGVQDNYREFLPAHREIAAVLSQRDIPYEYHEMQGKHDWPFWNKYVQNVLERFYEIAQQ